MQKQPLTLLRQGAFLFGTLLLWMLLSTAPLHAQTPKQDKSPSEKLISLNFEEKKFVDAIRIVMKAMHANYVLNLKMMPNVTLTIHLNRIPAKIVLETLLRASGVELTYMHENDIYYFVPIPESNGQLPPPPSEATGGITPF